VCLAFFKHRQRDIYAFDRNSNSPQPILTAAHLCFDARNARVTNENRVESESTIRRPEENQADRFNKPRLEMRIEAANSIGRNIL
jgi:hypothetical protein